MAIHAGDKGKRAEREVATMLRAVVEDVFGEGNADVAWRVERNLMQSRMGGYDVSGIPWLAVEVKHHAKVANVATWWQQTVRQAGEGQIPALFYKGNNIKMRVRTIGYVGDGTVPARVWAVIDLTVEEFMAYVKKRLEHDLECALWIKGQRD